MQTWNTELPPAEWYTPDTPGLSRLVEEVGRQKLVAIDTETTGLDETHDVVLYWSIAWRPAEGKERRVCLRADTLARFNHLFQDPTRRWVLANAKYDMSVLANTGYPLLGECCDVAVMHALLYEEESHGLKEMTLQMLGWTWADFASTFGKVNKKDALDSYQARMTNAEQTDVMRLVEYAANDAYGTLMLYFELQRKLQKARTWSMHPRIETLWDYFVLTELPYTRVLWSCERAGLQVDLDYLDVIDKAARIGAVQAKTDLTRIAGRLVNPHSHDDLRVLLYQDLGLKPRKMTKGGKTGIRKPSCDKESLEELMEGDLTPHARDCILALQKYTEVNALISTFIPALRGVDKYGRVHTHFRQAGAATGRLSSSDPNFQNMKSPDKDVYLLRKAIIAAQGNCLLAADYSALEMMVLACAAQEEEMLDIFRRGWDIHMGNAAMVFGYPYEDMVKAKKTDKLVKEQGGDPALITEYVRKCLDARQAVKTIGYG